MSPKNPPGSGPAYATSVGIDMSADPKSTAIATIAWATGRAEVVGLELGASDAHVRHALHLPGGPVGIDCPLGWPDGFIDFITAHRDTDLHVDPQRTAGWRRDLVYRRTDIHVHEVTGITPLSVAADRISHTALRLAALLSEVASDVAASRDGSGDLIEVYPAAALSVWGLPFRGYKGTAHQAERQALVEAILEAAPWLHLGSFEPIVMASDDALDAVVCALVAWAARHGATSSPPLSDQSRAATEGWIHLPVTRLPAQPWGSIS